MTICFQPHLTFYLGMCHLLGFTHFILLYDTWVVPLYWTWKLISWENSYLVEQAPISASRSYSWTKPKWNCCIITFFEFRGQNVPTVQCPSPKLSEHLQIWWLCLLEKHLSWQSTHNSHSDTAETLWLSSHWVTNVKQNAQVLPSHVRKQVHNEIMYEII